MTGDGVGISRRKAAPLSQDRSDRPSSVPWPPLLYGAAIIVAIVLGRLAPLGLPSLDTGGQRVAFWAGLSVLVAGAGFDASAMWTMARARANILPHRAATALVTSGPFAFSRNPIYLGNTLMMVGAGLSFGNPWLVATGFAAAMLVERLAIRREEQHLDARFGPAWRDYSARVGRWFGRR